MKYEINNLIHPAEILRFIKSYRIHYSLQAANERDRDYLYYTELLSHIQFLKITSSTQ